MATTRRKAASGRKQPPALRTRSVFGEKGTADIAAALNLLLADVFTLYLKTKNFHWHVSGPHFRSYHLLLDEQAAQILAMTDDLAERVRKVGGLTIHSIGEIARLQRIDDNDVDYVEPSDMLAELREDNLSLVRSLKEAHDVCDDLGDIASASMIEVWVDEAERRVWFLFELTRSRDSGGR